MITDIQEFAAHFGASTPMQLHRQLWMHDSYTSSATFKTAHGNDICTDDPDFTKTLEFPSKILVSVVFNAHKEGLEYEPTMTPLTFPFSAEDIEEAIEYLDEQLDIVDEYGHD